MTRTTRLTYVGIVLAGLLVAALLLFVPTNSAGAANEPCVPKDAYTEVVIVTPAVPAIPAVPPTDPVYETVVVTPAVSPAWANFSPNDQQATFIGPPIAPSQNSDGTWNVNTDPRGTWHIHLNDNTGPGQDESGVYPIGNADKGGNWFWRQQGADAVTEEVLVTPGTEGTPEVPAVPAVTQEIFHPAVVCTTPTETPTVTETPVVPTETVTTNAVPSPTPDDVQTPEVTVPDEEKTPVSTPNKDKPEPKPVYLIECVDGVFVTTVNGEVVSKNGSCVERDENDEPVTFSETGL